VRKILVLIHRWAGLATAGFLIITGLTGSLLAFYPELQRLTTPERYSTRAQDTWLGAGELAAKVEAAEPRLRVLAVDLQYYDGTVNARVEPRVDAATGRPFGIGYSRLSLDPASGAILARIGDSFAYDGLRRHIWSFIYRLHYALALGSIGKWVLGITALTWTLDCFVAFLLTLPPWPRISPPHSPRFQSELTSKTWWERWAPSWRIRWRAGVTRRNFDLHRAGGLWLWPMLLIFAWSSVGMDLMDTVYTWTTQALFEYRPPWTEMRLRDRPLEQPVLDWSDAQKTARALMATQAQQLNFKVLHEVALHFDGELGVYTYQVQSDREIDDRPHLFSTQLSFDANSGELKYVLLPSGQYAGNTVSHWLYALHMANVFGFPYRVFVCLLGIAIVALSVTGFNIWYKKRMAYQLRSNRG